MVVTRSMTGATKKPDTKAEAARAVPKTTVEAKPARSSKKATAKSKRAGKKLTSTAEKESRKAKRQERIIMTEARSLFLINTFRVQHMEKHPEIPVVGDVWTRGLAEWDSLTDSAKGEYASQVQQRKAEEENIRKRELAEQAPPNRKRWIEYAKLPHVRKRRMAGDKKWWDGFVESTSN